MTRTDGLPSPPHINFDTRPLIRSNCRTMSVTRPIVFWIAMLAAVIAVVVLLREVLLPFVAGMFLAYLLDPLANRLERLGMNRLVATLTIVGLFFIGVAALIVLTAPTILSELGYFLENFPLYIRRLQGLATDPNRPWLSKIIGEGLAYAEKSVGDLTTLATELLDTVPAFGMDRGPRADLSILAHGRDPDRCLLPHL